MDHNAAQSDHVRLRVDEIAQQLHVTRRTVYSMIEREKWLKEEGVRNKVWYHVPVKFIDEYVKNLQEDHARSQENIHTASLPFTPKIVQPSQQLHMQTQDDNVNSSEELYRMIIGDRDQTILELKESLDLKNLETQDLRKDLASLQAQLIALEIQLAEQRGQAQGKDSLIKAKDDVIQAKEQAINAANAAVMLMEQQKQTLEAEMPKQLIGSQGSDEKKGWLDKLLGR